MTHQHLNSFSSTSVRSNGDFAKASNFSDVSPEKTLKSQQYFQLRSRQCLKLCSNVPKSALKMHVNN